MSRGKIALIACAILSVGMCAGIVFQRVEMSRLQAAQIRYAALLVASPPATQGQTSGGVTADQSSASPASDASSELLRLRSEVGQLTQRKRELAAVQKENKQLHAQLVSRSTNIPAGSVPIPPGYIRTSQAQWVGYNTPENTVQSFLWAFQNHDITNIARAFAPDKAEKMLEEIAKDPDPFKDAPKMPGMRVVNQELMPDGRMNLEIEITPNQPTQKMPFRQINGEWKIDGD